MRALLSQVFLNYVTTKSIIFDMEAEELDVPEEPVCSKVTIG